jgi:hypothetical protein
MRDDFKTNMDIDAAGNSLRPQTATATVNGVGIDLQNTDGQCGALLNVGAVSGTAPTLDVKVQESNDNSTFVDVVGATFTQVTASNRGQCITFKRSRRFCRLVGTIAGTSPSFALAGQVFGFKKNV